MNGNTCSTCYKRKRYYYPTHSVITIDMKYLTPLRCLLRSFQIEMTYWENEGKKMNVACRRLKLIQNAST